LEKADGAPGLKLPGVMVKADVALVRDDVDSVKGGARYNLNRTRT
jgi:hypothetical protein